MTDPITVEIKTQHLGAYPNGGWVINRPPSIVGGKEPIIHNADGLSFFRTPKGPVNPTFIADEKGFFKAMKLLTSDRKLSKYVLIPGYICMGDDVTSRQYPVVLLHAHESGVYPTLAHFFIDRLFNGNTDDY